ncbi:uncharacterized protein LOC18025601 isoform X5 [Eutrema salsugineum]|uniref:uncharacterized protein LOC18025601 isoform X5 n=1 Tax=Eutrema salsugineum TaxID=72664 RepID=UPI000CED0F77|nr:uncharacterized protein LOC18025601 isoform X5 [Eutrema salsugineum]
MAGVVAEEKAKEKPKEEEKAYVPPAYEPSLPFPGTRTSELGMINNIGPRAANLVGAGDAVNAQANSQEIQAPAGENYSFEIKAGFINMVQSNKFYGYKNFRAGNDKQHRTKSCKLGWSW